ncbi:DUF7344 domain-containing protein [Halomarina rubra]|uniref:Helix-turn-helix domain-containing protein n=1 Tax=Halomarina rubra TaxID=2071873 RepID=A0ABD6APX4_9EURY|nr:helix-turn-helix domain-containing protein [Halomarina rubra]
MVSTDTRVLNDSRSNDPETTLTAVHHVLTHPTRRAVLRDLTAHYHPMTVHDLAGRLTRDPAYQWISDDAFDECRIGLVHHHLPKLAAAGLIRNPSTDAVELTEAGFRVEGLRRAGVTYLDATDEELFPARSVRSD